MGQSLELPGEMACSLADRQLRIALIYSRLPFPMMRGDQLTVSHLIAFLKARGHAIDLYTLDVGGQLTGEQQTWLARTCHRVSIYGQGYASQLKGLLNSLVRGLPFQVGIFRNPRLERDVRTAVLAGEYDVVYVYYLRSAPVIPDLFQPDKPVILNGRPVVSFLALQLSQTLNTQRIYENQRRGLKKIAYWLEWQRLKRYEARIWQHFTKSVLIGSRDAEAIRQLCREQRLPEIHNVIYGAHGTDTKKFLPASPNDVVPNRIVFSGAMGYEPNVQAVLWFFEKCWPYVRSAVPDAELVIQGNRPAPAIRKLRGDGVVVTGTVADVGILIRSAAVCINPMRSAGGMQNKLVEYMACEKAVVATSVANEGIMAPAGTLVIADNPDEFGPSVVALLKDRPRAEALGAAARAFVLANWTWEAHFSKLEAQFLRALNGGAEGPD